MLPQFFIPIQNLDKVFKSKKIDEAYLTFPKLRNFQMLNEMSRADYIKFEHLYHQVIDYEMSLPNIVLIF